VLSDCKFHGHGRSEEHTVLTGVHKFPSALSTFILQFDRFLI